MGSNCAVPDNYFADFRVACEYVTLEYHGTGQNWVDPEHASWYQAGRSDRIEENTDAHAEVAADFVHAIREGRPAKCPIREAYEDLLLVSAVIASAKQGGQPVAVETN